MTASGALPARASGLFDVRNVARPRTIQDGAEVEADARTPSAGRIGQMAGHHRHQAPPPSTVGVVAACPDHCRAQDRKRRRPHDTVAEPQPGPAEQKQDPRDDHPYGDGLPSTCGG
jgi:hypothetical protein